MFKQIALAIIVLVSTSAIAAEILENRLQIIGAISNPSSNGQSTGIVVIKDTKDNKTIAVEIGKPFTIDNKAYSVLAVRNKKVIITDGVDAFALAYHAGEFKKQMEVNSNFAEEKSDELYEGQPSDETTLRKRIIGQKPHEINDSTAVSFREKSDSKLKQANRMGVSEEMPKNSSSDQE